VDILAPRRTPVRAVDAGTIARLFTSKAGGLTIYQFDPGRQFVYYYAHLDSYEPALREGDPVLPGQVIAYVGTTGNAPPDTPHLHFAISRLASGEGWWQGTPVDPYEVFRR
jgi:murein DD-endopeptidase MepM/ murein hydrolase activator NlpD